MADFWLLWQLRWRLAWNRFRARKIGGKIGIAVAALWVGGWAIFLSGLIGFGAGALLRRYPEIRLEPLLPGILLTAVALILLLSSFGVALGALFFSRDLDLLMSAPVDRRAVFTNKILDGVGLYYVIVLCTAVPALLTYGIGLHYGPLYYLLALVTILASPLLPAGFGALLVLLVARFAPARRVKEFLGFVGALVGLGCGVLGNTSRLWTSRLGDSGADPTQILQQAQRLEGLPVPSLIAGRGLALAGGGHWLGALGDVAGFLAITAGFFVCCVLAADRLYAAGWVRMQSSGVARRSRERAAREAAGGGWLRRAPAWVALALKDWRVIPRDLRNFAQMLTPLLILPVVYVNLLSGRDSRGLAAVDAAGRGRAIDGAVIVVAFGVLTTTFLICSRVALTGISMEGRSWWILKAAPLSRAELLGGKYATTAVPFAALSTVLLLGAALWKGFGPLGFLFSWFAVEVFGAGMLALTVGCAVPWANLEWDDPRKMRSGWGAVIAFVGAGAIVLFGGAFLALPFLAEAFRPALILPAWVVGLAGATAVSAGLGWAGIRLGARALPRVGEA
ncbi:MAG TPA: hypothetical protein VFW96_16365 [Thermomicrobiales bacterium]|nr:hypothetical protein [Thermomicrobiales bacterium]